MPDPLPLPVRVALGLCADVLAARAVRLRAGPTLNARRHGQHRRGGGSGAVALDIARACDDAARQCRTLSELRDLPETRGSAPSGDVDAAVLGYLLCFLRGYSPALAELREELIESGWPRERALSLRGEPELELVRAVLLPRGEDKCTT